MKRFFATLLVLAALGGGGWWGWRQAAHARGPHDWQPLAGGGEVRLLAITQGTVHRYQEPGPPLSKRLGDAIRTRSFLPLKNRFGGGSMSTSTGKLGICIWLQVRGGAQSLLAKDAELTLPGGHKFYNPGGSGGSSTTFCYTESVFDYLPVRAKTLHYACKLGADRFEFDFDNPAYRTDLPVWKGAPLPQTQQHGDLALTLRALIIERAPNYFHHSGEEWRARPVWTITKAGEPASEWFQLNAVFGDPSGQMLRECGLFEEPVWKVRCYVWRTNRYPFREDEIAWLGTAGLLLSICRTSLQVAGLMMPCW